MTKHKDSPNLLPCPFCGSGAIYRSSVKVLSFHCANCRATGPKVDNELAIQAWNTRSEIENVNQQEEPVK